MKISVDKLVKAEWNYKKEDAERQAKLEANIKRNGQVENIIVREKGNMYEIVNGNHRLEPFIHLGMSEVMCFNLGVASDAQARRLAIETNETRFDSDAIKLADLIREIGFEKDSEFSPVDLAITMPFTEVEMVDMVDMLNFDWEKYAADHDPSRSKVKKDKPKTPAVCPSCGHKFEV